MPEADYKGPPPSAGVPPTGEEIHLPGPTLVPLVNALGVALALIGLAIGLPLTAVGLAIFVISLVRWVRDTRRDISQLPAEHR
jgi:hypothetical protein